MLEIFKITSFLLTALFGIYGSVITFWQPDGRISNHGVFAVAGIVASALTAAGLQIYEDRQSQSDMVRLLQTNSATLDQINRALYSLDEIEATVRLDFDLADQTLLPLVSAINEKIEGTNLTLEGLGLPIGTSGLTSGLLTLTAEDLEDDRIGSLLCGLTLGLSLSKSSVLVSEFRAKSYESPGIGAEDLFVLIHNDCLLWSLPGSSVAITYSSLDGELTQLGTVLRATVSRTDLDNWLGNGRFISVLDLAGAELSLQLFGGRFPLLRPSPRTDVRATASFTSDSYKLVNATELTGFKLRLAGGAVLNYVPTDFTQTAWDGGKLYQLDLPTNIDDILGGH
ncbi:MAG: hypothetical protein ACSHW1_00665 [Yoonia sp.]|uniref:hypothetical protein n=1 Tax=Yoonia sp. TaxID=2212373 RepID=UPI003EF72393